MTATLASIVMLLAASAYIVIIIDRWQYINPQETKNFHQTSFVYDLEGSPITDIHGLQNRINVPLDEILF